MESNIHFITKKFHEMHDLVLNAKWHDQAVLYITLQIEVLELFKETDLF